MIKRNRITKNLFSQSAEGSCLLPKYMYLILIETSGNQRFIFSTNKLRENVGASELTYQIGKSVAEKYINEANKIKTDAIKPIITTSGKALVLADDKTIAKNFVRDVTNHALVEMPGLTVHGAISKKLADNTAESLHKAFGEVHIKLESIRHQIPSNLQRFQRIPFVAECDSSNLPAQNLKIHDEKGKEIERQLFSNVVLTKRNALVIKTDSENEEAEFKRSRVIQELEDNFKVKLFENLESLEKDFKKKAKWLAVVHADGNGLGQIFLSFEKYANMATHDTYKKDYQDFSDEIDKCTKNAFGKALQKLQETFGSYEIPVVPLILGGDDITFICHGEYAINLTKDFLFNFERENSNNEKMKEITKGKQLGICAGIAIIKPNFPFHQAYHLAEELLQSAKKVKNISTSLSALDYHVLYDSSGTMLEEIREKTQFVARPYIVSEDAVALAGKDQHKTWVGNHHFSELEKRVNAMTKTDSDDKKQLPNSQLHILREGLFIGEAEAEARANLINHRYEDKGFDDLLCEDGKLFFQDDLDSKPKRLTHLLDAMDIVELWKGGETNNNGK